MCNEILDLRKEKEALQKEMYCHKDTIKKIREVVGKPKTLGIGIENVINYFVEKYFSCCTPTYIGTAIADSTWASHD